MPTRELRVRYRREKVDRCTGSIVLVHGENEQPLIEFDQILFREVLVRLSRMLRTEGILPVFIERLDAPGLLPLALPQDVVELLVSDPVRAIHALDVQPSSSGGSTPTVRRANAEVRSPAPVFRAGYDTLAQAFGTFVYCRRNQAGDVECPACGRWTPAEEVFVCPAHGLRVWVEYTTSWAKFRVKDLLATGLPRFYLPRQWNPSGGWITRDDLQEKERQWEAVREEEETNK